MKKIYCFFLVKANNRHNQYYRCVNGGHTYYFKKKYSTKSTPQVILKKMCGVEKVLRSKQKVLRMQKVLRATYSSLLSSVVTNFERHHRCKRTRPRYRRSLSLNIGIALTMARPVVVQCGAYL